MRRDGESEAGSEGRIDRVEPAAMPLGGAEVIYTHPAARGLISPPRGIRVEALFERDWVAPYEG